MTTLSDQLQVDERMVARVAERDDMLHQTTVSITVGVGTERHGAIAHIWAAREAGPHPLPGYPDLKYRPAGMGSLRTNCGAQRGRSSVRNVSLTAPVTCERCLAQPYWAKVESMPEDILTTDPRTWGGIVLKEGIGG